MGTYDWYQQLEKPLFAPPSWVFGPVWSVLYVLIAVSFGYVFVQVGRRAMPRMVAVPFGLNLVANLAFSPIQFRLQSNVLAAIDILLVVVTLIWAMMAVAPYRRWVMLAQIPYLLWVSFATVLQLSITWLNW